MSKLYKSMGDIGNIYKDDGEYEAEVFQEYDADGKTRFQVYRFPLERKSLHKGKIIPHGFHKRGDLPHAIHQYEEWFSSDLDVVGRSADKTKAQLARELTSSDPVKRFWAYFDIGGYHGFDNLDSYPLDLSELELSKRERGPTARRSHTKKYGYVRPGSRKRHR